MRAHASLAQCRLLLQPQECVLLIGPEDGLSVRLEDESKTLQSSIFMRPDVRRLLPIPRCRRALYALHMDYWSQLLIAAGLSISNAECVDSCALQLFSAVHCPGGRKIFGVQFGLLLDTLQVSSLLPNCML